MLQAGVRVSDVAQYCNCHPSIIQRPLEIVTRLLGQLNVEEGMTTRRPNRNLRRLHR